MTASPEAELLRLCVREQETLEDGEVGAASRGVRDWQHLVDLAVRHRVTPYLLDGRVEMPAGVAAQLRAEELAAQAVVMLLDAELRRVHAALASAGVGVMILKGPGLARELYPDPRFRTYADLDLTIHEQDGQRAATVLTDCGYRELAYDAEEGRQACVGHHHASGSFHRLFAGSNERALIELHLDSLQLGVRAACEAERWTRAVPVSGLPGLLMLGPEDQLVQLSVHAHKHGFSRLIWLKDLDLLLRSKVGPLCWDLVVDIARREGACGSVWYALSLAAALLKTPVPTAAERLRPRFGTRLLYRAIWSEATVANLDGRMRRRAVQFHAADSWRGMLPSLVLMGRRAPRLRMLASVLVNRAATMGRARPPVVEDA
jgi:hypothetical protein